LFTAITGSLESMASIGTIPKCSKDGVYKRQRDSLKSHVRWEFVKDGRNMRGASVGLLDSEGLFLELERMAYARPNSFARAQSSSKYSLFSLTAASYPPVFL
jgi:hypothetical protein